MHHSDPQSLFYLYLEEQKVINEEPADQSDTLFPRRTSLSLTMRSVGIYMEH